MRYVFPTFRQLLVAGLCASMALVTSCTRQPVEPPSKQTAQLLDKDPNARDHAKKPTFEDKSKPPSPPELDVIQRGVTLSWTDESGRGMTATARSDSFNLRTQVGTLIDFSAKLYDNGALLASVKAPHAYVDTAKRVIVATGGVDLKFTKPQTQVRSSWIKWTPDKQRIVGNGGVTMTYANGTASAAAFVADTNKRTLELLNSGKGLDQ